MALCGIASEGDGEMAATATEEGTSVEVLETEEARNLLEAAQAAGRVSPEEIALSLDELELEPAQIEEVYRALEELQVEIVDAQATAADRKEEAKLDQTVREVSTDALQLFLKDIGKAELLTAAEEGELCREPLAFEIARDVDLPLDEVEQILRTSQAPVSLEKPVGDEEESEFGHFLTEENAPLPDEAADKTLRQELLTNILGTLSHRERRVLELRYGLNGEQPRTLDEVGRAFNVTRERIRQIENQSLKKLRALGVTDSLKGVA